MDDQVAEAVGGDQLGLRGVAGRVGVGEQLRHQTGGELTYVFRGLVAKETPDRGKPDVPHQRLQRCMVLLVDCHDVLLFERSKGPPAGEVPRLFLVCSNRQQL